MKRIARTHNRIERIKRSGQRFRREGRRLCSVFLCASLVAGNCTVTPFPAFAEDESGEYEYEFERASLKAAIREAVAEGALDQDLNLIGTYAEEYADLLESDGSLYEVFPETIDEDRDRDRALDLRIFARIEGSIPVDDTYVFDGSEELIFLLENKTDQIQTAAIGIEGMWTDEIEVLPAASVAVDGESGGPDVGSSSGGSGGRGSVSSTKTGSADGTVSGTEADLTGEDADGFINGDAVEDSTQNNTGSDDSNRTGESQSAKSDNPDDNPADITDGQKSGDEANSSVTDSTDDTTEEGSETSVANADADDGESGEDDGELDAGDTSGEEAESGSENNSEEAGETSDENDETSDDGDNTDTGSDEINDSDSDTAEDSSSDTSSEDSSGSDTGDTAGGSDGDTSGNDGTSRQTASISLRRTAWLSAPLATDSNVEKRATPSDATASDAGHSIDGELLDAVLLDGHGAVGFVTTAADLWLDANEEGLRVLSFEGDDYQIEISYSLDADLPESTVIRAKEYAQDSDHYQMRLNEAAELYGWKEEEQGKLAAGKAGSTAKDSYATDSADSMFTDYGFRLFDISLVSDGAEIEPEAEVTVTMTYTGKEEFIDYTVVHFDEKETTVVDAVSEYEDGSQVITFGTDAFSEYGLSVASTEGATVITDLSALAEGGNYYLNADIEVSSGVEINSGVTTILDLNGYTITYTGTGRLFTVNSGGNLTITDTEADTISDSKGAVNGELYGNAAELTEADGNYTLIYYVTESEENGDGTTTETLYQHTVEFPATAAGKIICANAIDGPVYAAGGGTVTIEGGLFYNTGFHIVVSEYNSSGSKINISGGYFTGATGNGIYIGNGTFNLSGGVIAGNTATSGGGVYINSGTFTMSGGVISGNTAGNDSTGVTSSGGGGVYVGGGSMTLSDGYITNNSSTDFSSEGGGSTGGGGIYFASSGTLTMSGGYVTGNYARDAGGGIYAAYGSFVMSGGTVAGNVAEDGEGGGMRIGVWNAGVIAVIQADGTSVYITNNVTNTDYSWGGGGIFVTDGNTLTIVDSVVTENSAGGFGGGVAGCSTGRVYVLDAGSAVYGNSAYGVNLTQSSLKTEDHDAAANSIFMNSGYEDFFCAMNSIVYDDMLGGGSANWIGSCDYSYIEVAAGGSATASTMMGLTAYPDSTAQDSAMSEASVYITGNSSYTHGGGIMSNGILLMGETDSLQVSPGLTIHGTKSYVIRDAYGETAVGEMTAGQFTFLLLDTEPTENKDSDGNVTSLSYAESSIVGTATNTADGEFLFSLSFPQADTDFDNVTADSEGNKTKTYTCYLVEKSEDNSITYDTTYYIVTMTVTLSTDTWEVSSTKNIDISYYIVTAVTITDSSGDSVTYTTSNLNSQNHTASVTIGNSEKATFTNTGETGKVAVVVKKAWLDGGYIGDRREVTVTLYRNGAITDSAQTITLDAAGGWTGTFSDLDKYYTDEDGNEQENTYTVVENGVSHYIGTVSVDTDSSDNYEYTITNIHDLEIVKVDGSTAEALSGAVFTLQNSENQYYRYDSTNGITWQEAKAELTTSGTDGKITLHGLGDGAYTLTEVTAPDGYNLLTSAVTFTVSNGKMTLTGGTGVASVSDNGLVITVKNTAGSALPETGGPGTLPFRVAGLLMMSVSAYLTYDILRRRRISVF